MFSKKDKSRFSRTRFKFIILTIGWSSCSEISNANFLREITLVGQARQSLARSQFIKGFLGIHHKFCQTWILERLILVLTTRFIHITSGIHQNCDIIFPYFGPNVYALAFLHYVATPLYKCTALGVQRSSRGLNMRLRGR